MGEMLGRKGKMVDRWSIRGEKQGKIEGKLVCREDVGVGREMGDKRGIGN